MKKKPQIYVGTSGWSYFHWKDNFYPSHLKATDWLEHYAHFFPTVEINTTFYHTPLETTVKNWFKKVPENFVFSIKINRFITHRKKLNDCEESLKIFYNSIQKLKNKIGPILIQLPPSFKINPKRLEHFISLLNPIYDYTIEFRHSTWYQKEIYDLLSKRKIALCITDLNGKLSPEEITSNFTYIRLHGPKRSYQGSYGLPKLKAWKKKIECWKALRVSVYCYFDNDEKGYAIQDAQTLKDLLDM